MPSISSQQLKGLFSQTVNLAVQAGDEILAVYNSDFAVEHKADRSPLTEADKRSHAAIAAGLADSGFPLLSEEGAHKPYEERRNWGQFWLVDPLDGTKEFVKRNGEFTVNIALIDRGVPVLGVIVVPVTGVVYAAARGCGAYRFNRSACPVAAFDELMSQADRLPVPVPRSTYTIVASRSHMSSETESFVEELRQQYGEIAIVSSGSSLKLCMVAEGTADSYPRFAPTMEWDTGAGHAIVLESGGEVAKADGSGPVVYNKPDLLNPWFIVRPIATP